MKFDPTKKAWELGNKCEGEFMARGAGYAFDVLILYAVELESRIVMLEELVERLTREER